MDIPWGTIQGNIYCIFILYTHSLLIEPMTLGNFCVTFSVVRDGWKRCHRGLFLGVHFHIPDRQLSYQTEICNVWWTETKLLRGNGYYRGGCMAIPPDINISETFRG